MEIHPSGCFAFGDDEEVDVFDVGDIDHALGELHLEEARVELHHPQGVVVGDGRLCVGLVDVVARLEDVAHHLQTNTPTQCRVRRPSWIMFPCHLVLE